MTHELVDDRESNWEEVFEEGIAGKLNELDHAGDHLSPCLDLSIRISDNGTLLLQRDLHLNTPQIKVNINNHQKKISCVI